MIPTPFLIAQYELAYRENPNDYLLCLCISVVYLQIVLQKQTLKKNTLVVQVQTEFILTSICYCIDRPSVSCISTSVYVALVRKAITMLDVSFTSWVSCCINV